MTKVNCEKDNLTDGTHLLSSSFPKEDKHTGPQAIESHEFNVLGDHLEAKTC